MDDHFISIFRQLDAPPARGKFLSRVFGIFSEEIVRIWAADLRCPYEDLGRPTLRRSGRAAGSTLDFTLRHRDSGKTYVVEAKCEIEYRNYKYLVLADSQQVNRHQKPAFLDLRSAASRSPEIQAFVDGREMIIDGAILIWGDATDAGRLGTKQAFHFADILTIADIVKDLRAWESASYFELLEHRRQWCTELFDGLSLRDASIPQPAI